jgi:hypothetical protein
MLRGLSVSLLAMFATAAYPQGERATITGTVTDSTQAIIAGAQATLRNVGTSFRPWSRWSWT